MLSVSDLNLVNHEDNVNMSFLPFSGTQDFLFFWFWAIVSNYLILSFFLYARLGTQPHFWVCGDL